MGKFHPPPIWMYCPLASKLWLGCSSAPQHIWIGLLCVHCNPTWSKSGLGCPSLPTVFSIRVTPTHPPCIHPVDRSGSGYILACDRILQPRVPADSNPLATPSLQPHLALPIQPAEWKHWAPLLKSTYFLKSNYSIQGVSRAKTLRNSYEWFREK